MSAISLTEILNQGQVWAGHLRASKSGRNTGFEALDRSLAQQGWPSHGLTEIQVAQWGQGELHLLLQGIPKTQSRLLLWLNPPYMPCAQGLAQRGIQLDQCLWVKTTQPADALWALERSLGSGAVDTALAWFDRAPKAAALKKLQLAAQQGQAVAHLLHQNDWNLGAATQLKIKLQGLNGQIEIERQRGGPARPSLALNLLHQERYRPRPPKPANCPAPAQPTTLAKAPFEQNRLGL